MIWPSLSNMEGLCGFAPKAGAGNGRIGRLVPQNGVAFK